MNRSVEKATSESISVDYSGESIKRRGDITAGDIVALLDSVSTSAESAAILVGRVVKVHEHEAPLMEFRFVDSSKGLYRPVVESGWWEHFDSLIYPTDIVYDRSNQVYELRTSPAEIFHVVFPEH